MASDEESAASPSKETEVLTTNSDSDPSHVYLAAEKASSSWKCLFAFTVLRHAGPLISAIFSSALAAAFRTVFAVVLGKIFDIVAKFGEGSESGRGMTTKVSTWCLVLVFLGLGNWLANTAFMATWIVFGEMQAKAVRKRIFASLLSRNMTWFDSLDHGVSSLLVRIQTQTRELQLATSQVLGSVICNAMVSIASLAVAFSYSWKLTLVLLATIPVSMLIVSFATRRLESAIQAQKHNLQTASKLSTASINAIDLVKVFNGYDNELRQYYQAIALAGKHYLTQARCNAFQIGFVGSWLISLFLVGFLYGVVLVKQGMKPGNVLTTFYATLAAFQGIEALLPHWLVLSKGMAAGRFLSSVASDADESNDTQSNGSLKLEPCVGNVEMTNVSFAYPSNPSKFVLNTSSFFFPVGEISFIVGRSGSGKSTIGNLLARFYEPLTGTIWLDGQSLNSFDSHWIQSHVTLIQQSSILFNDTLLNNIALGHKDIQNATLEEIVSASEFALLQSTLRALPDGLDTTIGTNGHRLSGGQKQRLALARARLRDPSVLILDEVTSSLDQISRSLIMDAIREWRRDKTTIVITHDVAQIHDDDFVHVLEEGHLVQKGFRRDLLQVQGPFTSMDSRDLADSSPSQVPDSRRDTAELQGRSLDNGKQSMVAEQNERRVSADFDESFVSDDTNDSILDIKDAEYLFGASERRDNIHELRSTSTRERLAIAQEQSSKSAQRGSLWSTLATLWPALSNSDRALFVLGLVICILGAASTAVFSFCFAKLLGAMWSPGDKLQEGKKWAIFLAVVAVIDGLSTFFGHYLLEKVAQAWVNSIRSEAMRRILRQPKAWFDKEEHSASRISECLERNSEEMRNVVGRFIPIIMFATSVLMISMTWAMIVSWKLTLVALSPLPVVIAALKAYTFTSKKWEIKCNQGAEEASALLNEIFINVKVVRALTLETHFEKKYMKLVSRALGMGFRRAGYTCGLYGLYESISYPLMALVYYYAVSLLARESDFTTTEVVQVVNLLLFSIGNATHLLSSLPQLTMPQATATQLLGYANLPLDPPGESSEGKIKIEQSPLPIEARDLTFAYSQNPHEQVLRGVSFDLKPGSCTAIVGPSGCGKSTIVSLLMGLYAPQSPNQLSFAHVSHSQLDVQHLRSRMAYVSQSPFLFPATVTENIAYGLPPDSPHRDPPNIYAAAQAAGIHDFITSLPQGYATPLGEGGLALSSGQAQRMSIARALVRHPQLLIMDEPTSALDGESSATLRETIRSLVQRCKRGGNDEMVIVLVTHNREMMQVAGNIIMIDAGVKVEEGSYEDLLLAGGRFRHLISGGEWKSSWD